MGRARLACLGAILYPHPSGGKIMMVFNSNLKQELNQWGKKRPDRLGDLSFRARGLYDFLKEKKECTPDC